MFPWFSQQSSQSLGARRRPREAALTGEGTLVFLITIMIVGGWLIWRYSASTEEEARAYADRSIQRLAFAHDANYLAANLSATALPGYPASEQQYIVACLTKVGVPGAPAKITGSVSHGSISDAQDPEARFKPNLIYPKKEATAYRRETRSSLRPRPLTRSLSVTTKNSCAAISMTKSMSLLHMILSTKPARRSASR